MSKQTAVEWLVKTLELDTRFNGILDDVINQAKAMEKEQIVDGHEQGYTDGHKDNGTEGIEYYNKTYKQ